MHFGLQIYYNRNDHNYVTSRAIASSYRFGNQLEYDRIISKYIDLQIQAIRVNCARYSFEINLRHIEAIRQSYLRQCNREPVIILDIPFPGEKIRLMHNKGDAMILFTKGELFELVNHCENKNVGCDALSVNDSKIISDSAINDILMYGDGSVSLTVVGKKDNRLIVKANNDGAFKYGNPTY